MTKITLKAARVNANLSRAEAAAKIGVAVSTLKNWETGKTFPNQPKIQRLCEVYGISFDVLFFDSKLA